MLAKCGTEDEIANVKWRMRFVAYAHQLYEQEEVMRTFVEAGILGSTSDIEIVHFTGMPVESVELYVNLFFDVRDRLGVRPFIMSQVLRKRPTDTITPSDWGFVVRFVGYVYGKSVLDTVTPLLLAPGLNVAGLLPQFAKWEMVLRPVLNALAAPAAADATEEAAGSSCRTVTSKTSQQQSQEMSMPSVEDTASSAVGSEAVPLRLAGNASSE